MRLFWVSCAVLLIWTRFLVSCGEKSIAEPADRSKPFQEIDLVSDTNSLLRSDQVFSDVAPLPLIFHDTTTFLAGVDRVVKQGDNLVLLDRKFTALYRFDSSGKFLNRIGRLGVGNGLFPTLDDMAVDSLGRVMVLASAANAVYYYAPEGGFLGSKAVGFYNSLLCPLSGNRILYYVCYKGNSKTKSCSEIACDTTGKVVGRYLPYDSKKATMSVSFSGFLAGGSGGPLFTDAFNDSVYTVDPVTGRLRIAYWVNFGPASLSGVREDHQLVVSKKYILSKAWGWLGEYACVNDDYFVFNYVDAAHAGICVYNRRSGRTCRLEKTIPDGVFSLMDHPVYIGPDNECYFAVSSNNVAYLKTRKDGSLESVAREWPALYSYLEHFTQNNSYFLLKVKLKS